MQPTAPTIDAARQSTVGSMPESLELIIERLDVEPYPLQWKILRCPRRKILMAGGERAGKSFTSALYATTRAPYSKLIWIVGPNYELARPEFEYLVEMLSRLDAFGGTRAISMPKLGKCVAILKTGQIIETKSADDVAKLAAKPPDGIIMAEAAQQSYDAYLKCIGRVAERRGWVFLSGTFEGGASSGWYADLFDAWAMSDNPDGGVSFSVPSWENRHVYPGGRDDPEIKYLEQIYSRVEGLFEERCGATPVPAVGLVFREFRRHLHVSEKAEYNPKQPVYLAVDPSAGGAPYAVLACQFLPCKHGHRDDRIELCHVVDEIYARGKIGEQVIEIAKKRPWWPKVKGGAIDVEAPDEQKRWLAHGKVYLRAEKIPQLQGIRREKTFLAWSEEEGTHLQINPRCEGLILEYAKYTRKDPSDDAMVPKELPPSNQPNHSIKALWYLLIGRFGPVKGRRLRTVSYQWTRSKL